MDFSIIVPVYNRPETIRNCVAACYAVDYPPSQYEVLVVDNGSTDQTARIAAQAGARVVSHPVANRCLARNLGAEVARGRWLAFTDSDCEPQKDWLKGLAAAEERLSREDKLERTAALAGEIKSAPPSNAVEAYIAARKWIDQQKFLARDAGRFPFPFAATANLCIRAEAFKKVGGFDPDMPPAEDADWCWRAALAGLEIAYAPEAAVIHHHRADLRSMLRQAREYGQGNAHLFAKHKEHWGREDWIERERYIWAIKGLLKTPWQWIAAKHPLERSFSWFDFLSNLAHARGRKEGGKRHGVRVI